jgi:hypothetical protein
VALALGRAVRTRSPTAVPLSDALTRPRLWAARCGEADPRPAEPDPAVQRIPLTGSARSGFVNDRSVAGSAELGRWTLLPGSSNGPLLRRDLVESGAEVHRAAEYRAIVMLLN